MNFYQFFGAVLFVVQIWHGAALELLPSTDSVESTPVKDHGFIAVMIQKLNMNNLKAIHIGQMGQTLQYCEHRIETITELIVEQFSTMSSENVLSLLTTIRDVFDTISMAANIVESSLNGIVGCIDLAVLDVQIALQVLVEAFIANCEVDEENPSVNSSNDDAMNTAVYCLSSAVKALLTTMSELVEKIAMSPVMVDADVATGLQMIVQTILNIIDRVLYCVKRMSILDLDDVPPILEKFSLIIQRLAVQRMSFGSKISPMIIKPIAEIVDSLKPAIDRQLPQMTRQNVDRMATTLASVEDILHEKTISATITSLLVSMQPMFAQLSTAIHSLKGITDAVAYSTDLSLQNLMAIIKCLTYYIAAVTQLPATTETIDIGAELESIVCFVASTIQTLIEGVTVAADRALIDLVCLSLKMDKTQLDQQLRDLQASMEPIFSTLENVITISLQLLQNVLALGACSLSESADGLIRNINMLVNNLHRIVKDTMESPLPTKEIVNESISTAESSVTVTNDADDKLFVICATTFQSVAQNSINLRVYVNKSIDEVRRYLIQM